MGLSFYCWSSPQNISELSRRWAKFAIVAFWFFLPFMQLEAPGKFLFPIAFLVMFWPFYQGKWKWIIIFFAAAVFIYGSLGARSTAVRFSFAFLMSFAFLFHKHISINLIKYCTNILLIIPFIFLTLGISGIFNIWNVNDYLGDEEIMVKDAYNTATNNHKEENLKTDTRTFLYKECISSALKNNYVIQGRSLARGYDSWYFTDAMNEIFGSSGHQKGERPGSEVSILNIFTYMGIIGVYLYFLVFWRAVRSVIKNARSKCMHLIAFYLAFRWTFAWIEDFTRFDLNNLFLWAAISMCFSPYFLKMDDCEFKFWASNFFPNNKSRC